MSLSSYTVQHLVYPLRTEHHPRRKPSTGGGEQTIVMQKRKWYMYICLIYTNIYTLTFTQGFIRGGGLESPPPPRNHGIKYGYYLWCYQYCYLILNVAGHKYVSSKCCLESLVRSNLRGPKFSWGWGHTPRPTHATIILLSSCFYPPPNSKSCMKPCLHVDHRRCEQQWTNQHTPFKNWWKG